MTIREQSGRVMSEVIMIKQMADSLNTYFAISKSRNPSNS